MENLKTAVYYSDFGAVGDGKANDFEALYAAHEYANEHHLPVFGDPDKTYYIGTTEKDGFARPIAIKTKTDWRGAKFIIDDTNIARVPGKEPHDWNTPIFRVLPDYEKIRIEGDALKNIGKIGRDTGKIDLGLGYPALLIVYNENHPIYIRYGPNANAGNPQQEIALIDSEGNLDPSTPFLLDYDEVSYIDVIRADEEPVIIENAEFTCFASRVNTRIVLEDGTVQKSKAYFHRGFDVHRSNTTMRNIKNYVKGEISCEDQAKGIDGPPYHGFYCATMANNVTIEDCVVTARRYYTPGTYGFGAQHVNNIVLKNCKQSNFYKADGKTLSTANSPLTGKLEYWGLGGTSYCKNMVYDGCEITRYDAHRGLYNGVIRNSHLAMINLIGGGDMVIENCVLELNGSTIINLREDYGSTWRGHILIKDCKIEPNEEVNVKDEIYLMGEYWTNHYFGYKCYMPSLTVDNLTLKRDVPIHVVNHKQRSVARAVHGILSEKCLHLDTLTDGTENKNPLGAPEFIRVINNKAGHKYDVVKAPIFENTEIEGIDIIEVDING